MNAEETIAGPEPDYRTDGSTELDPRAALKLMVNEPAIRNYVFAAFGSLAMIVLLLLEQGSDIGAILIAAIVIAGVLLRFTAAPIFMILVLGYFMWTPTGIPGEGYSFSSLIEARRFHFIDVILVLATLVCVASQYRLFGLVHQAIAFEGRAKRKGEPVTRRPASLIRPTELSVMLGMSVVLVIAGQLIWLLVTSVEVATTDSFPLRWAESRQSILKARGQQNSAKGFFVDPLTVDEQRYHEQGILGRGPSRFFAMLGMLFFGVVLTRLVFRYWQLRTLGPAEGAMILLDSGWEETHRERVRLEKWRIWGRKRAEARTQDIDKSGSKP